MTPITDKIKQLPTCDNCEHPYKKHGEQGCSECLCGVTTSELLEDLSDYADRLVSNLETAKRALEAARIALTSGLRCTCSTEQCEACAQEMDTALAEVQAALKSE